MKKQLPGLRSWKKNSSWSCDTNTWEKWSAGATSSKVTDAADNLSASGLVSCSEVNRQMFLICYHFSKHFLTKAACEKYVDSPGAFLSFLSDLQTVFLSYFYQVIHAWQIKTVYKQCNRLVFVGHDVDQLKYVAKRVLMLDRLSFIAWQNYWIQSHFKELLQINLVWQMESWTSTLRLRSSTLPTSNRGCFHDTEICGSRSTVRFIQSHSSSTSPFHNAFYSST